MKKLYSIILILACCIMPMFFAGCDQDYSSKEIIATYNTITSENGKGYFKDGKFTVRYGVETVSNNIYNVSSPLYILGEVYEPLLLAASEMVTTQFASSTIEQTLESFSKSARSQLAKDLNNLDEVLVDFNLAKDSFEKANRNAATGSDLSAFVGKYNALVEAFIAVNTTFCQEYYSKITLVSRKIDQNFTLATGDITNEIMQTKLYIADFIYSVYVKNYTMSNPPKSINSFIQETTSSHLKDALYVLDKTYATGSVNGTTKLSTLKRYLTTMRDTYDGFISDFNINKQAILGFDYKGYFAEPSKIPFVKEQTVSAQDDFNLNQNFLDTKFTARLDLLDALITTFVTI